jgi:ribose 1,5-bisphosphokinase
MAGRLVYLMGPSGSGKDTILRGLRALLGEDCHIMRRVVTRPDSQDDDAEDIVGEQQFETLRREGRFAMHWQANGLCYGVPIELSEHLSSGQDVLLNGSREYLPQARLQFRRLMPVLLRVEAVLLRQRLHSRKRESDDQIAARMLRNGHHARLDRVDDVFVVDNSDDPERAIQALYHYLKQAAHSE